MSDEQILKLCRPCGFKLPLSEFGRDRWRKDGLTSTCRVHRRHVNYRYSRCSRCRKFKSRSAGNLCRACYCGGHVAFEELGFCQGVAPLGQEISMRDILKLPMNENAHYGMLAKCVGLETPMPSGRPVSDIIVARELTPEAILIEKEISNVKAQQSTEGENNE